MTNKLPYRIIGFYDSETNNIEDIIKGHVAYPILHQLGLLNLNYSLSDITTDTVYDLVSIKLYRHTFELCEMLDNLCTIKHTIEAVPVIAVHNLGFDMYALSSWLDSHEVKVLAKSSTKPISFTILDEAGEPSLVLWDTLQFSGKSLERMGADCGLEKLSGTWDYQKQRTPYTKLTAEEIAYAKQDIYTLAAWLGFWCRNNPDIDESKLGLNVVTKTGIVRAKRSILFDSLKCESNKYNVGRFWMYQNRSQMPQSDDELFTVQTCTRGGFTFCASSYASKVFSLSNGKHVYGYDATSMHPSQMVSHAYPQNFRSSNVTVLNYAAKTVRYTSLNQILNNWYKPFPVAFEAAFAFTNLRPKENSLYTKHGIFPLSWARVSKAKQAVNEDNESQSEFINYISARGYKDSAVNPVYNFGKLVSADSCILYLTELAFWEVCQAYDFDSVTALYGYITNRFCKPTDMSVISVMHFYTAKRVFKAALHEYETTGTITNPEEVALYAPAGLVEEMASGTASLHDVQLENLNIKSMLNALYGVECTNEFKDDTILTAQGIGYAGKIGLDNAPKNPKSWYQFGHRIVAWSRIMQHCAMRLVNPYVDAIVCGDTDSIKLVFDEESEPAVEAALAKINTAIDKGKEYCTSRVKNNYPDVYDELKGIGYYVKEFSVDNFCAAWNKAYVIKDDSYHFTIAGITTNRRYRDASGNEFNNSYNDLAAYLENAGYTFKEICSLLLGYNVMVDSSITKINGRKIPEWTSHVFGKFTDYLGDTAQVSECASLALFNMPKLINNTDSSENFNNMQIALVNNPEVNTEYKLLRWLPHKEPAIITL